MPTPLLFHKFTDIRAWQFSCERHLHGLYHGEESARPILDRTDQHEQLESLDEYSYNMMTEGTDIVLEHGRVLWGKLAMDPEEQGFAAHTELGRKEIVLAVLAKRRGGRNGHV